MKTIEKVCTKEQAKTLWDLDCRLITERYWRIDRLEYYTEIHDWADKWNRGCLPPDCYPALDVAELGEMLLQVDVIFPAPIPNPKPEEQGKWWFLVNSGTQKVEAETEAQARCAALIWLIENGHLKPEQLEKEN